MAGETSIDALASYLPRRLVEQLAGVSATPTEGKPDTFPAAAFLADLTGFTALSADLAHDGAAGAEKLTAILDRSLGGLVDLVFDSGGDVVNFAGDAVIAIWPADDEADLRRCVYDAASCARRAQKELGGWEAHPGHVLNLRIGIGAGSCTLISLGDENQRWGWVAAGEAMLEVGHAERSAEPGQTVLSAAAAGLLGEAAAGERRDSGSMVLESLADEPEPDHTSAPSVAETAIDDALLEQAIRAYLPAAVLSRIDSGHTEWLAELRTITAVFVNLPGLDPAQPAQLQTARALVGRIKDCLDLLGGTLNKILVDDKGMTVVLGFGLPPLSHEDDEVRGVRAALRIEEILRRWGVTFGIGVSTGRAFCGAYGNEIRREYTMLGDSVNLAARLMQLAHGVVWCDAETARVAVARIAFEDLGHKSIRGKSVDQRVHRPLGALDSTGRHEVLLTGRNEALSSQTGRVDPLRTSSWDVLSSDGDLAGTSSREMETLGPEADTLNPTGGQRLVGREAQEQVLRERLDGLGRGERALVLVEGEAGMGKSLLLATLQRAASFEALTYFFGSADPVRTLEPYHAWREIFAALFGVSDGTSPDLSRWFSPGSHLADWAPLLGPVLGLAVEETESTQAMNGPQRADATRDLLIAALTRATEHQPVLVVLDDGHWLDASSWQLAVSAARLVPDLMLVLSHRPMKLDPPRAFIELTQLPTVRRVRLDALPDSSVSHLACRFLGVEALAPAVERLLVSRAAGNPFFCEEMVHALRDAAALELEGGTATFSAGHSAETVNLPGTLQGVVVSRLDRLPPEEQLTLKVASVLGRTFGVETLQAMHPVEHSEDELLAQLDHLAELDLCPRERGEGEHAFKHALVQEACYELLVLSKRRALHEATAEFYESTPHADGRNAARLAHHWRLAGKPVRALLHLEAAGFEALENGSDRDALGSLEAARELLDGMSRTQKMEVGTLREAELLRGIGTALQGVGRPEESADTLRESLSALGRRLPSSTLGWVVRLLLEGARQLAYRLLPGFLRWSAPAARHDALKAASQAASWYANASYFRVEAVPWLAAGLLSANLAENAASPHIAGTAYVNLANIFGTLHLRRIERLYMGLAALSAEKRVEIIGHSAVAVVDMLHCSWDAARATIGSGTAKARAAGDWWALGNGLIIQALIQYLTGPIADSLPTFDETVRVMRERGHPAQEGYGLVFSVSALLALDRVDDAWEQLAQGEEHLDSYDYFGQLSWHAGRAAVLWQQGDHDGAVPEAVRALRMFAAKPLMLFTYAGPFSLIADVLLAAKAEARPLGGMGPMEIAQHAKKAVGNLGQGGGLFWYFRPRAQLAAGMHAMSEGNRSKAAKALRKGLQAAEEYGMPWDQGRIHLEMARQAEPGSPERAEHERAARELLEPMGAVGTLRLLA